MKYCPALENVVGKISKTFHLSVETLLVAQIICNMIDQTSAETRKWRRRHGRNRFGCIEGGHEHETHRSHQVHAGSSAAQNDQTSCEKLSIHLKSDETI